MSGRVAALVFFLVLCLAMSGLAGCKSIQNISEKLIGEGPTKENTLKDMNAVVDAVNEGLQDGKEEITLFVAVTEEEISAIGTYMSPFWGKAARYSILSTYDEDEKSGAKMKVRIELEQSVNYYAYQAYLDPEYPMPAEQTQATELLAALKEAITEIYSGQDISSEFDQVLAAHDWLVKNVSYGEDLPSDSPLNSAAGALIDRVTMCQGYSEALQLILLCATDVQTDIVVGNAMDRENNQWVGHAWNIINIDGTWMHVDATFDDPLGSPEGLASHYYFGQTDEVMRSNHEWAEGYWPSATETDFAFYRRAGLYVDGRSAFELTVDSLTEQCVTHIELAVINTELTEDRFQFVYTDNPNVETLTRSLTDVAGTTIVNITPTYTYYY